MKVCSLCQREFEDQLQFCTRDGTKLTRIQERGYCRRCGKDYPHSLQKCPLHGTPLTEHGPRTILGDNFCHLCDSDFPKAFKLCPVHGIALQTSPLKKKLRNKIDATDAPDPIADNSRPPDTNPLPRPSYGNTGEIDRYRSAVLGTADLPRTDALVMPEIPSISTENGSRVLNGNRKDKVAAEPIANTNGFVTGHLSMPEPVAMPLPSSKTADSAPLKSDIRVSAAEKVLKDDEGNVFSRINRRHVISAITVALALIVSVSAYNVYVKHSAEESIRFSEPGAQNGSQAKDKDKVNTATVADSATDQVKAQSKSTSTSDSAIVAANVTAIAKPKNASTPSNAPQPDQRKAPGKASSDSDQPDSDAVAQNDKTRPIFIPKAKETPTPTQPSQEAKENKPDNNAKDNKPAVRDVFEQVTPARPGSARVVPSIRNRRRIAVPGGFHYYFEVVLNELNGVGVNWDPPTIEHIAESGTAGTRTGGYDFAIGAHGHSVVKVEVDMIGSTAKDWKGTAIYHNKGKDENGHQISISYRIPLDENFKD